MSTSEEEQETDRWEVESESSHEEEITKEPMEEEDTELVGSATTDTTLGSVVPSSKEAGWLEDPLDLSHLAGGNGGAEPASAKCGLDTPMVGGDAASMAHKEQREGQSEPSPLCHPPRTVPSGQMSLLQRCPSLARVTRSSAMPWRQS